MHPQSPVRIGSPAKLTKRWLRRHAPSAVALSALWFAVGCANTTTIESSAKDFTARLKGNYGFTLNGSYFTAAGGTQPYQEIGTLVADGKGNITGGTDDFVQNSVLSSGKITGTYAVAEDGTGGMILNMPRGQIQLAMTLGSDSGFYLIEFDSFANGAGVAVQQSTSDFTSTPSGTFIFHFHSSHSNNGALGSVSTVGRIQISSGSVSGVEDVVRAGVPGSSAVTGALNLPDANGRGTATLTDNAGTTHYVYYINDSSTLRFLQTDSGILGGGRVERQSSTTFNNASLNNGFAFSSSGETIDHLFGANSEGAFTADGNGNIVSGSYDAVQDGNPITNVPLTGTYVVDPTGRATITLNPQGLDPITQVAWMVSSSRGFFLVSTPDRAEDGRLDQQQGGPCSASSLKGPYAFYMFGYDTLPSPFLDRVGIMNFDGASNLSFTNYLVNRSGTRTQEGPQTGTYEVSANGRVSASVDGVSDGQVIYLTAPTSGSLLIGDSGSEVAGSVEKQALP